MHFSFKSLSLLFVLTCFAACKNSDLEQITNLEQAYQAHQTPEIAKTLIELYKKTAKASPSSDESFNMFVHAAKLQEESEKDPVSALRWLDDAIQNYGTKNTDKGDAYLAIAELFRDYNYKTAETYAMLQGDVDKMYRYMNEDQATMEKVRLQVKEDMVDEGTGTLIPNKTEHFLNISEALAMAMQGTNPSRYVELNLESGNAARGYGNFNRALQMYFSIYDTQPESPRAPEALFLAAFTYDNDLKDFEKAKQTYKKLIEKYPNTKFAHDSKALLSILGKPLDEVIQGFETK